MSSKKLQRSSGSKHGSALLNLNGVAANGVWALPTPVVRSFQDAEITYGSLNFATPAMLVSTSFGVAEGNLTRFPR
jgi:hypothetical protein